MILRARRQRGYPVMRGDLALDGRLVLSENGTLILILDTWMRRTNADPGAHSWRCIRKRWNSVAMMVKSLCSPPSIGRV